MTSKKLLVLDVNGLLVDTYFHKEPLPDESPHARVGSFYVYKRPFCEEFLQFCLDNFMVGVWSSAREYNVNNLVDYVFGDTKEKLVFTWHQSDCTDVGLKSPDNQRKPLFLKELSKLWRKVKVDLPWSEGDYGPSNTLLVDDTPYKAILNPPNTAIFPRSYTARDHGDNFLGNALRSYLKGIRDAASVQTYVESNPFGEPSITPASPLWSYVSEVVLKVKSVLNKVGDDVAQIMPVEAVSDEGNKEDKSKRWRNRKGKHHSDPSQPVEAVSDEGNKEDKPKRWRNKKRKHHSDPSQLANNHSQFSDFDFPSEAVELQSSEFQTDRVCSNLNQPFKDQERPSQVGKGVSLPSGLEEPSKDEHQDRSSLFTELGNCDGAGEKHCDNTGVILSLEQGLHGAHEAAKQAANSKQGDLKGVGKAHEEENQVNSIQHHENESFEKSRIPVGDDGLNSLKPDCMQGESNNEKLLCGRRDMRDNNYVRASNINYGSQHHFTYSNRTWHKHRGTWEEQNKRHNQRNDTNRGSFRSGQGWMSEGGYRQDGRTKMPFSKDLDQRGHQFVNKQHIKYVDRHNSGKGYLNRNKPSFGYARHSQKRWGDRPVDAPAQFTWGPSIPDSRSWDQSQQDCRQFSNTETSTNASFGVLDSNFSTQPFNSQRDMAGRVTEYNEFGRGQDGGPSSYSWHQGFDQGAACERSNVWPERTEQLNVNVHNPDSHLAVQPEARRNGKRQRLDFASKEAGASSQPHGNTRAFRQPYRGQNGASRQTYQNAEASSQPYRNAGAFSQPYRAQHGASRQPYQNVGASNHPYHNNWDKYRQGLPPGGFSRSRQSQEGRNL